MPSRKTKDQFLVDATSIHGSKYDYSLFEYTNTYTKSTIICNIHGKFLQSPNKHVSAGNGCPKCRGLYKTTEDFIVEAVVVHGSQYDYSEVDYKRSGTKVKIICRLHGSFYQLPTNHILSAQGCMRCSGKTQSNTKEFIEKSKKVHGSRYDYSLVDYVNNSTPVIIYCKHHGNFNQVPLQHLQGSGCALCTHKVSLQETDWLDYCGVPKTKSNRQLSIIINNKRFQVDGFIPETNTVYEYWGDYWHGNPIKYKSEDIHPVVKKTYGELYQDVLNKRQSIMSAGFNLVEIWESDWKSSHKQDKFLHKIRPTK